MSARPLPSIFREYDIRGTYGSTLSDADALAIGGALAAMLREDNPGLARPAMAVGRDGRLSSPALEAALVEGLLAGGVDVLRIGVGPTPMLYYAEASMQQLGGQQVQGGVQITGSHNPADENGFKIVFAGAALFGARIERIGQIARAMAAAPGAPALPRGALRDLAVDQAYVRRLLQGLDRLEPEGRLRAAALRIGWDAGNGAAGAVLKSLVAHLPGEHHLLFAEVNGHFPHHHPDPTVEENLADLRRLVAGSRLDFGVAFDGDGDRIVVIDSQGRTLLGDQLLAVLAQDLLRDKPGSLILADIKSSSAVAEHVAAHGGRMAFGPAGHSLIKSEMKRNGAALAGETTGHIFYADRFYGFDDALYAAVRLIAALARLESSVDSLRDGLPQRVNTPELRFAVAADRKRAVVGEIAARLAAGGAAVDTTDGIRVARAGGWWLLRASNTQDMLTARAEAQDEAALAALLAEVDAQLAQSGVARA